MSAMVAGAAIAAGGALLSGLLNASSNREINKDNIKFQREVNEQNEGLMRESWERDDTAVQRRAADLQASGISPLMAAGSAASNSGPVNMSPPKKERSESIGPAILDSIMKGVGTAQQLQGMRIQDDAIKNQNLLTEAQAYKLYSDAETNRIKSLKEYGQGGIPMFDSKNRKYQGRRIQYDDRNLAQQKILDMVLRRHIDNYDLRMSKKLGVRTSENRSAPADAAIKQKDFEQYNLNKWRNFASGILGTAAGLYTGAQNRKIRRQGKYQFNIQKK